ncbi:phosphotransferase, partial [Propionicimonas sp.]|uniref:phosphotransferase n=1 Tax=Propionicimonas sp. TaxID=1955623 RepID=UPI0039E31A10
SASPFRGVPLAARAQDWEPRVRTVAGPQAWRRWQQCAAAPAWAGSPVWIHGDPHPLNLLLHNDGTLAGVIDFGDVGAGDPACDLAAAWLLFDSAARGTFQAACTRSGGYDQGCWSRAWAWALGLACVFALASDDMPALAAVAGHGLAETLADPVWGRGRPDLSAAG